MFKLWRLNGGLKLDLFSLSMGGNKFGLQWKNMKE